ncbi:hypothetical protein MRY87_09805, partial [bacterium]|nr:hypothetical protein [bacterium]
CDQYFTIFRSCNVGCYTDSWCCTCPKCLFTALILAPFLEEKSLAQIFPKIPLNDTALSEHLLDLCLSTRTKPFECVGTHEESLALAAALLEREEPYPLLSAQSGELQEELSRATSLRTLLGEWNNEHQLPSHYEETLREQTHRWHPPTPSNSREVRAR